MMLFPLLVLVIILFFISLMFGCGGDDGVSTLQRGHSEDVTYIELVTPQGKVACVLTINGSGIDCRWPGG